MKNLISCLKRNYTLQFVIVLTVSLLLANNRLLANTYNVSSTVDHPITGMGINVNNTTGVITGGAGNGLVTLRSAVHAANNQPGTHTIILGAFTYQLTIPGTGETTSAMPAIGDLDLNANNVTIQGAGMNSTIIQQTTAIDRVFDINVAFIGNFNFTISNLTIRGGRENTGNGGGGIFIGSANNLGLVTITNCKFFDNQSFGPLLASGLGGGGLQHQGGDLTVTGCIFDQNTALKSGGAICAFGYRNLPIAPPTVVNTITITNSTFTNNQCSGASGGGAIDVFGINLSAPNVTITGCTFTSNVSTASTGGAIVNESSNSMLVEKCTFLNNTAPSGGGVYVAGGGGSTIRFCRFVGNTASSGNGNGVFVNGSTLDANNNWWGVNTNPVGPFAGSGSSGILVLTKWLQLKHTASPASVVVSPPGSSTLTASFLTNNLNEAISTSNLTTIIGLPIVFNNAIQGSLSEVQTTIQSSGTATAKYTVFATACPPTGSADAKVDNATVTATITIIDNIPPTVSCPSNVTVSNDPGLCGASVALTATAMDNCPGSFVNYKIGETPITSPHFFPKGTTTVIAQAQDASGNLSLSTCSYTVTVNDTEPPTISCTGNKTVSTDADVCTYTHSGTAWDATGTDNCITISFAYSLSGATSGTGTSLDGKVFNKGTTTVLWTATDGSNNTNTCSFTVTVNDNQNPTISCTTDKTVNTDAGVCTYTHSGTAWNATGTDNCPTLNFAYSLSGATTGTGSSLNGIAFNKGVTTVLWTATDGSNNTNTCSFTVTVNDIENPTVSCPQDKTVGNDAGVCTASVTLDAVANDNCPGAFVIYKVNESPITNPFTFPKGTTTVVAQAQDAAGNLSTTCSFTVTVNDTENPTVNCTGNKTANVGTGLCTYTHSGTAWDATGSDNCTTVGFSYSLSGASSGTGTSLDGQVFNKGITTVLWTATDGSSNTNTCSFTVTINDTENPTISCTGNQTVNADASVCTYTHSGTAWDATGTDNCTTINFTYSLSGATSGTGSSLNGQAFNKGVTTVLWTATDGSNNTNTCSFTVTVNDTQAPTITCPSNITAIEDPQGSGSKIIPLADLGTPITADNCPGETWERTGVPAGNIYPVGTTILTYTVTDLSGLQATCQQTVTVNPACQITCPVVAPVNNTAGQCGANVTYTEATTTGNCGTLSYSHASGSFFPVGTTTVTVSSPSTGQSCTFDVTVNDTELPVVSGCPSNVTVYTGNGNTTCTQTATWTEPTATDNCTNITTWKSRSHAPGSSFSLGTTTVTYVFEDAAGNQRICNFTVTVEDNTLPVISGCPMNIPANAGANCLATANWTEPTATDNCGGSIAYSYRSHAPGSSFGVGTTTVTYKFTDAAGNESTCSFNVIVSDITPPTVSAVTATPNVLWPPDHKMKDIVLTYTSGDNCGCTPVITVTSTDPISGAMDGDKFPDWIVVNDHLVQLRAERGNGKEARVYKIRVSCTDASNNTTFKETEVRIAHNITAPITGTPFKVGSTVNLAGVFWDKSGNKHTAQWLIDDNTTAKATVTEPSGTRNGKVAGSYKFTSAGIYKLQMNVTDQNKLTSYCNTNEDMEAIVVIYDPNGGYTYGGGYFNSPAGALTADPAAIGKANYGFTVNYYKNATLPKGETQFEFKVGEFEYNALNFEYLSVAGYKAVVRGAGKIIGGQSGIEFMLYVVDGAINGTQVDKIRLKIFNKNTGEVYYDSEPGKSDAADPTTPVGPGSTVVISNTTGAPTTKKANEIETSGAKFQLQALPNPSNHQFILQLKGGTAEPVNLSVKDAAGRSIEARSNIHSNTTLQIGSTYRPGIYLVEAVQGKERVLLKLIKLSD